MDPFVLDACIDAGGRLLDLSRIGYRAMRAGRQLHLLLELPAGTIQLDLRDAGDGGRIAGIRPMIDLVRPVEPQFHSARRLAALLEGAPEPIPREPGMSRLVAALRVGDALAACASQREIGLGIFGDDWPGDGEHLKSRVRRMILFARELVKAGPRGVLQARIWLNGGK